MKLIVPQNSPSGHDVPTISYERRAKVGLIPLFFQEAAWPIRSLTHPSDPGQMARG